jgi:4-hydroxybenzoate polyprenyltransferase
VTAFAVVCAAGFVASTLLFLPNSWPVCLSLPVLLFLCGYSFTKRFTVLAHFWLGAALGLAPIAAWLAVRGEVAWPPVVLGADILYACQDVEYDSQAGLHSVPARLGIVRALRLAAICHLITVLALLALPYVYPQFGWIYTAGIIVIALLLAYEHRLVRPDDLTRVNIAFFHVNAVISIGLFVLGVTDLFVLR